MVAILPTYDIGGQIGQGLGQGLGDVLKLMGQQKVNSAFGQGFANAANSVGLPGAGIGAPGGSGQGIAMPGGGQGISLPGSPNQNNSGYTPNPQSAGSGAYTPQQVEAIMNSPAGMSNPQLAAQIIQARADAAKANMQAEQAFREQEQAQEQALFGSVAQTLSDKGVFAGSGKDGNVSYTAANVPSMYTDIARSERNKILASNPKMSLVDADREAARRVGVFIEDTTNMSKNNSKQWFDSRNFDDVKKNAAKSVQDIMNRYGDSEEIRDHLLNTLKESGFSDSEARQFIRPMSSTFEQAFNNVPDIGKAGKDAYTPSGPGSQYGAPTGGFDMAMGQYNARQSVATPEVMNKTAEALAKGLGPNESIKVAKDRLVREKGFTDKEAMDVINRMQNSYGYKFSPSQERETSLLSQPSVPGLWDLATAPGVNFNDYFYSTFY